jgi:hypothetical protein
MNLFPKSFLKQLLIAAMCRDLNSCEGQGLAYGPQTNGFWLDRSTGLMWASKDNGRDINWREATKFCRQLRLGGYSDWRLATIEELEGLYDGDANAPGLGAGKRGGQASTWHVKGNIFLTGNQWSSSQRLDDRGLPSGLVWYFDFWNNRKDSDDGGRFSGRFSKYGRRALCVRKDGS